MNPKEHLFVCDGLHVAVAGKEIVRGVSFVLDKGEKVALMGPNGSGKSSLANAIMGNPSYAITAGRVYLNGQDITDLRADEKARLGLFLAFQYPVAIPGVSVANFLRAAVQARRGDLPIRVFRQELMEAMKGLEVEPSFAGRYLNEGFSGGEKKRIEILQMELLRPAVALLDETDSGLDIDALRTVADGVNRVLGPESAALVVTHYQRLLNYIKPDRVHVLMEGRIERSGGPELALALEEKGYEWIEKEVLSRQGQVSG
jgi:Fe-S cluster assembly ATP-binding protein